MRLVVGISPIFITIIATLFTTVFAAPMIKTEHSHNGRVHSHILPNTGLKHFHRHSHNGRSHIHPFSADIGFKHTHNSPQTKPDPKSVKHQHGNRWHSHPLPGSGLNHPHRHKHGGRTHSHPLPASGINHYHRVNPQQSSTTTQSTKAANQKLDNQIISMFEPSTSEPETTPFNQDIDGENAYANDKTETKTPALNMNEVVKQLALTKKLNVSKKVKKKAKRTVTNSTKAIKRTKTKSTPKSKKNIKDSKKLNTRAKKAVTKVPSTKISEKQQITNIEQTSSPIESTPEEQQLSAKRQFEIGLRYENGKGIEKNVKQAVKWYRRAAEQGHTKAQYNLASLYERGEGVEKNLQQAMEWYKKAAEQSKIKNDKNTDN